MARIRGGGPGYFSLLKRYIAFAGIQPIEGLFSEQERKYILDVLEAQRRSQAVLAWNSDRPGSVSQRTRGFLAFHSDLSFSTEEIRYALKAKTNTVRSSLIRLLAKKLISKSGYDRWTIRIDRC